MFFQMLAFSMERHQFGPFYFPQDIITYNSSINAMRLVEHWQWALALLRAIETNNLQRDTVARRCEKALKQPGDEKGVDFEMDINKPWVYHGLSYMSGWKLLLQHSSVVNIVVNVQQM